MELFLLLDQFSRNIWRGQARAYQGDLHAQRLSQLALNQQWLEREPQKSRRQFWLMPLLQRGQLQLRYDTIVDRRDGWRRARTNHHLMPRCNRQHVATTMNIATMPSIATPAASQQH